MHFFIFRPSAPNSKDISRTQSAAKQLSCFISVWVWSGALLGNDSKKWPDESYFHQFSSTLKSQVGMDTVSIVVLGRFHQTNMLVLACTSVSDPNEKQIHFWWILLLAIQKKSRIHFSLLWLCLLFSMHRFTHSSKKLLFNIFCSDKSDAILQ